jgi:lysine 2,3-aminomutase
MRRKKLVTLVHEEAPLAEEQSLSSEETEPPGTSAGETGLAESFAPEQPFLLPTLVVNKTAAPRSSQGRALATSVNSRTRFFRRRFYPAIPSAEWNDWRWQLRNVIRDPQALGKMLRLSDAERSALEGKQGLPLAITPYYASLLDAEDPSQPLRRCVVPTAGERVAGAGESEDPLSEDHDMPVPGLVHRYPDRALFLVSNLCSTYCRYCTRSRVVGHGQGNHFSMENWKRAIEYIAATPAIRDVLISGGDPLTLADDALEWLLSSLAAIPHVEFLRLGTKVPAVLPQRVTPALTRMLRRFHPLWMSIHFTHPDEITSESAAACGRLADAGIPLGSQTVLLAGINDDVETMKALMHGLLKIRVKPYYLYQCDPIPGSSHFRTPVEKGLAIIEGLRGHTTGYAVPSYVIDAPGGGGKIPLLPSYYQGREGDEVVLRNYEGKSFRYPDTAIAADRGQGKLPFGPDA